jgi:hypothetical protein
VSVQLLAQEAKAGLGRGSAQYGTRALEKGRALLDSLPYPERPDNHFVVHPEKFDYYAMDCHLLIGDDQIIGKTITPDGRVTAPMRRERYPGEPAARDFQKLVDELTGPPAA